MKNKFKPGDRVVYHASARAGRWDLNGYVGTVQRVDGTRMPYEVKFDRKISEPMEGNCWHCCEQHLTAFNEDKEEKQEDKAMGKPIWSKETDGVLRRMKKEGASAQEIADALGLTAQQVYNRVAYMNSKRPIKAAERADGSLSPDTAEMPVEKPSESADNAVLNPLEETLKEQILELVRDKETLLERISELEGAYSEAAVERHALRAKCDILQEENGKLRERLEASDIELKAVLDREAEERRELSEALQKTTPVKERHPITREGVLKAAISCVCGDRDEQYGSPEQSFDAIAALWNAYLHNIIPKSVPDMLSAVDVAVMMTLLKIARISTGVQKDDSWIDAAGYIACGAEIAASWKNEATEEFKEVQ